MPDSAAPLPGITVVALEQAVSAPMCTRVLAAEAQALNLVTWVMSTTEALEAYAAFAERREPSFTGRWAVSRTEHTDA